MPLSVFGIDFSVTDILLVMIFVVVTISLIRLEDRANLIIHTLSDIERGLEPLFQEVHERREHEIESRINQEFPNPIYEKIKRDKDERGEE